MITSRQVQLFAGAGGSPPGPELVPIPILLAVVAVALIPRGVRRSVGVHVVALSVAIGGLALVAAGLGAPFANATADYCGDLCRTQTLLRAGAFLGWPALACVGLALAARADLRTPDPLAIERANWSKAWIAPTLILGYVASAASWRLVFS